MKTYLYKNLDAKAFEALTQRPEIDLEKTYEVVRPIMADVQANGDQAVKQYTEKFDGINLDSLELSDGEIQEATLKLDKETKKAFQMAAANIEKFHKSQVEQEKPMETMEGVICFREPRAIEKVGIYVPAGTAPLPSTVLMLGIPAKIAGCNEVVLCTPPPVAPEIVFAAGLCGITKIFQVGGAQAIAAMTYGTESIPKVYKIFGPGNQYVTAAKMLASLDSVAIDMPAGPSEVLVIADESADVSFIAADLLSQAEHGPDSQVVLLCLSERMADKVKIEVKKQLADLPRRDIAKQALSKSFVLVCSNLDEAFEFSNNYAPEHLILNLDDAESYIDKVVNAGSVFIGKYSCESAGDYASGTNHTLPTYGYAKAYSGVSVDSFVKKITFQKLSKEGVRNLGPIVEKMAECEQLLAHKNAMTLRMNSLTERTARGSGSASPSGNRAYQYMNFALEQIRRMRTYNPPIEQRAKFEGLRLDFNERLAPLPVKVLDAMKNFDPQRCMMYPSYGDLVQKIAKYAQVDGDSLMITNGADQGMELIFRTFVSAGDKVVIPSPSFAMFYQVTQVQGAEIIKPKYKSDGNFPLNEVMQLFKQKPRLVIICNPNNPTGTLLSLEKIEAILKTTSETLMYVDEAYFEFSQVTAAGLIKKYPNLFITRTFSKAFGLAALRIGYLMSCKENIDEMLKVRGPYDINQIAKVAAQASLETLPELRKYCDEVMDKTKPQVEKFFKEKGVPFYPSGANFIYFKEPFAGFSEKLESSGILIRPQADGYARVTIGTPEQVQQFIEIFTQLTP